MAKLIDSQVHPGKQAVLVEKGDTLSEIAVKYGNGATYKQLAAYNDISNPDLIYIGQIIELVNSSSGSSSNSSSKATINNFGLQSNSNGVLFATWKWDKSNTDNYKTEWSYDTGDGVWFIGSDSTTEYKQSTYTIPSNAKRVRFRVKPISKTYQKNNKETSYWTASWSSYKEYVISNDLVEKPSAPTVTLEKYKLTAEVNNLSSDNGGIQFQVVKDNNSVYKYGTCDITTRHASFSCTVVAGHEYKVRCRPCNKGKYGEWSEYSSNVTTIPAAPDTPTAIRASSDTSIYLEWEAASGAKKYDIEYTTKKEYFDGSDQTTTVTGVESTHYEKTGLESGKEYFFRVRAVNDSGESAWSGAISVVIGKAPGAPTTWSSTTTAIVGENLTLYWVHNAEDGSSQTYAELELTIDGVTGIPITIKNSTDEDEKDKTSFYAIDTNEYSEGSKIQWRVRTAGVTLEYGDWSIQRTIDIYAPPTVELTLITADSEPIETVTAFPVYVSALAGPNTQMAIGYHLSVTANEAYETVDSIGNAKTVRSGEEVYSKHFDISDALMVELSANNIDLENNITYTITCTASMNSGLTATETLPFTVEWSDISYEPNAEISIDPDTLVAYIRPYCKGYTPTYYRVTEENSMYTATNEVVEAIWGQELIGAMTKTGEQVYSGILQDGTELLYHEVQNGYSIENVILSVYRREFDGSFVEIASGLENAKDTFVTDPHPALDYARYRIVATSSTTGAVSYCDIRGYPVGEKAVVIQWDEEWTNFDISSEDELVQPPWSGSLLKLPYNIDVSDNRDPDVELVEYIGRSHPVSYYGTHVGETATWNVEIVKDDKETLYALRRLSVWMGDVYVREPSGSGYWANITVSFNQKHRAMTIPVTLNIVRVEGGI